MIFFPKNKILTKHPTIPLLPPHITTPFRSDAKVYITSLNVAKIFNTFPLAHNPYSNTFYAVPGVLLHHSSYMSILGDLRDLVGNDPKFNRGTIGDFISRLDAPSFCGPKLFYPDNPGFKIHRKINRLYGCSAYDTSGPIYWKDPSSGQWYIIGILGGHHKDFDFLLNNAITDEGIRAKTLCFLLGVVQPFDHFAHYWITSTIDIHMGMSRF